MRISAILFALPAALLRKTRRTKRRSDCDHFSEDATEEADKEFVKGKSDLELITGCLNLSAECRVFVVPKPSLPNADNHDHDQEHDHNLLHDQDHEVFCELKKDLNEKHEL